jgi:hypothetical protein
MLDYILVKVDRCSMMHSLEVRAPFLDRDLAEFACRLPIRMKLRGGTRKYLLKKAVADILPREILARKKRGFLIPSALWLRETLKPHMDELLGEAFLKKQGLFDPKTVAACAPNTRTACATTERNCGPCSFCSCGSGPITQVFPEEPGLGSRERRREREALPSRAAADFPADPEPGGIRRGPDRFPPLPRPCSPGRLPPPPSPEEP